MKPSIVWQTDFSLTWGAVNTMRGVVKQIDSELECFDITHDIEQFNILAASRELAFVVPFWPKGTIFVSVVDPGVGTKRKACVAKLKDGNYVITPDNGTLTHVYYEVGIEEVREIDTTINRYKGTEDVSVFHGRDIFAYTAARLASSIISFEEVGPIYPANEIVVEDYEYVKATVKSTDIKGIIISVLDPFGSIVFNILTKDFIKIGYNHGDIVHVKISHNDKVYFEADVPYEKSFGYVDLNKPVLFNSSSNYISIGLNQNSFKDTYHIKEGKDWVVELSK
ncbi:MAG TPA: SAM-dependent chlorinase/fluorinase [Erysipelotrichaceae bacterium]|nr:SAM-dependent chlorinase/fluorinase [Erysipelotrichaceae bacterium]HQA84417.1 SAM-dependent chlorinase/fluorinase [Erysipelotrichaceae bacterium]